MNKSTWRGRFGFLVPLPIAMSAYAAGDPVAVPPDSVASAAQVTITGTRLRRTDRETSSPVDIIRREDIANSGKRTLSDVVRSLAADSNGSISLGNVNGFAMGSSGVALRGLAVNATLVLINGRRMATYGLADDGQRTFVNLSIIPLDVVERIEVLKDGGSAIYGSDAIAGVVNIILRDSFEGASANASYRFTQHGGGQTPRVSMTAGRGNLDSDGYNVFFNVEASSQKSILSSQRSERKWIGNGDLRPYGYALTAGGVGPNIGGWFDNSTGASLPNQYGAVSDAALATPAWQQLPGCTSTIPLPSGLGGCAYDRVKASGVILPREDKLGLYLRGSMKVSEAFNPYVELGLFRSNTRAAWVFGPTSVTESWVDPATDSVVNNAGLILPAGHPDNPLGVDANLSYITADLGQRVFQHDSTTYRTLVGGAGRVAGWDYDTGLLYAHNTTRRTVNGFVRNSVLRAGLDGTGPDGYYRIGANSNLDSAAFRSALSPTLSTDNTSSLTLVDLKASREWFSLPGGNVGVSIGAEFRHETLDAPAMPYTDEGDLIGWSYYVYGGSQSVTSAFAEIDAPVLTSLKIDAALRADKVSDSQTSVTPKGGFKWTPWDPLTLRGTYAEGFRAPNPAEKGSGNQFAGTLDMTGNGFLGVFRNTSNPNLTPEKSRTVTLGLVFEPRPSSSLGVTFWTLQRRNEINSVDPFAIVAGASGWPDAKVVRDASGNVLEVSSPYENNSRSRLRGIDIDLSHAVELAGYGALVFKLGWTHLGSFRKTFDGGASYEYAGTHGPMAVSGNTGTPREKANATLSWQYGRSNVAAYVNYVSGFQNKDNRSAGCAGSLADGSPAPAGCRIPSFTTVNLSERYKISRNLEAYLGVTNLFDRIAPLDPSAYINLNFDPSMHLEGAIGRAFDVGVKYDF